MLPVHGSNHLYSDFVITLASFLSLPSLNRSGTLSHRKPRLPSWPSWTPSRDESPNWSNASAIWRPGSSSIPPRLLRLILFCGADADGGRHLPTAKAQRAGLSQLVLRGALARPGGSVPAAGKVTSHRDC